MDFDLGVNTIGGCIDSPDPPDCREARFGYGHDVGGTAITTLLYGGGCSGAAVTLVEDEVCGTKESEEWGTLTGKQTITFEMYAYTQFDVGGIPVNCFCFTRIIKTVEWYDSGDVIRETEICCNTPSCNGSLAATNPVLDQDQMYISCGEQTAYATGGLLSWIISFDSIPYVPT